MLTGLVKMFSSVISPNAGAGAVQTSTQTQAGSNPFANPFVSYTTSGNLYGQNKPVRGGYFAGYYNGQPNIVGKRLFLEV